MVRQVLTYPDIPPVLTKAQADTYYLPASYTPPPGVDAYTKTEADTRFINVDGADTKNSTLYLQDPTNISVLIVRTTGNAQPKFRARTDGRISWGDGTAGPDCDIERVGVSSLRTNSHFSPTASNTNDLGTTGARWRKGYLIDGDYSGNVDVSGSGGVTLAEGNRGFRHGASNYGTMIYAKFGYGGDGNNPRMQFGCNAYFPQFGGGARPAPVKDVSGLASGVIFVEAGGSGGGPDGQVPLVDFIYQDGGWTSSFWTPAKFNSRGTLALAGGGPTEGQAFVVARSSDAGHSPSLALKHTTGASYARFAQAVPGSRLDLSANCAFDGTSWQRDDTSKISTVWQGNETYPLSIYSFPAGANPIVVPSALLNLTANGVFSLNPAAESGGLQTNAAFGNQTWLSAAKSDGILVCNAGATGQHNWAFGPWLAGTVKMRLGNNGDLILYPDSGAGFKSSTNGVVVGCINPTGAGHLSLETGVSGGYAGNIYFTARGGGVMPSSDGGNTLGGPSARWGQIYSTVASISTSHVSLKQGFAPLDPVACAAAVLETDWFSFQYKPPAYAPPEIPEDDPERDAKLASYQEIYDQQTAESEDSRKSRGYVLGSNDYQTADLFGMPDRYSANVQADLAVVACALQAALLDIAELKARLA